MRSSKKIFEDAVDYDSILHLYNLQRWIYQVVVTQIVMIHTLRKDFSSQHVA